MHSTSSATHDRQADMLTRCTDDGASARPYFCVHACTPTTSMRVHLLSKKNHVASNIPIHVQAPQHYRPSHQPIDVVATLSPTARLVLICVILLQGRKQHVSRTGTDDVIRLLRATSADKRDTAVGIYYIGVDFEYRRQGIGSQLLDYVSEVAQECRWDDIMHGEVITLYTCTIIPRVSVTRNVL